MEKEHTRLQITLDNRIEDLTNTYDKKMADFNDRINLDAT